MPPRSNVRELKPVKDGLPPKPPNSRRRQVSSRVSAACEACKKRKTKCTGGPSPCQLCHTLGTECIIDLSLDMRRRAAFQRTLDESKGFQDTLKGLLDEIRGGPSTRLDALFEYIRSGASADDVSSAVHDGWDNAENQDLDQDMTFEDTAQEAEINGSVNEPMEQSHPLQYAITPEELETVKMKQPPGRVTEPQSQNYKDVGGSLEIARLIAALKESDSTEGEELLLQFIASQLNDKVYSIPSTASSELSESDGVSQHGHPPSMFERSGWHPALQARSQVDRDKQRKQGLQAESATQRTPDASPVTAKSGYTSPSTQSSSQFTPNRYAFSRPTIDTDNPMDSGSVVSPNAPYFESAFAASYAHATSQRDLYVEQENQTTRLRKPVHLVLPLTIDDDSYMSRTYTHYVQAARQMLESGVPVSDVLGPLDQVVVDLFFRPRSTSDMFNCASWACEVSRSYDHDVFVRLASVYMLTCMMRWLLVQSPETYHRIPDMMKPTPAQCMIPHIGAIETILLPPLRDAIIHHLRDWLTPLIRAGWSVNWPYGIDAAIEEDPKSGSKVLTSLFTEHVSDYSNWSVARCFLEDFPEVTGHIRIHDS